jgi:hypothetical protein
MALPFFIAGAEKSITLKTKAFDTPQQEENIERSVQIATELSMYSQNKK